MLQSDDLCWVLMRQYITLVLFTRPSINQLSSGELRFSGRVSRHDCGVLMMDCASWCRASGWWGATRMPGTS